MDMKAMIKIMSKQWQEERAASQMTLGKLIDFLNTQPSDKKIAGFGEVNSYRGYYSDLAFEPSLKDQTVSEFLEYCKSAMGEVFEGYKGGEFVMGRNTPLWIAFYGETGPRLIEVIEDNGVLRPVTKAED